MNVSLRKLPLRRLSFILLTVLVCVSCFGTARSFLMRTWLCHYIRAIGLSEYSSNDSTVEDERHRLTVLYVNRESKSVVFKYVLEHKKPDTWFDMESWPIWISFRDKQGARLPRSLPHRFDAPDSFKRGVVCTFTDELGFEAPEEASSFTLVISNLETKPTPIPP
jgi:hypothetical protein